MPIVSSNTNLLCRLVRNSTRSLSRGRDDHRQHDSQSLLCSSQADDPVRIIKGSHSTNQNAVHTYSVVVYVREIQSLDDASFKIK